MPYIQYNQQTGEILGDMSWSRKDDPDVIFVSDVSYNSFISPKVDIVNKTVIEGFVRSDFENRAIQIAKDYRDNLWNTGSPLYNGKYYVYNENLKGIVQAINSTASASIPDPRSWQADDGTIVSLSHADFMAIGIAEITRKDAVFTRYVTIINNFIPVASPSAWTNIQLNQFVNNPFSLW